MHTQHILVVDPDMVSRFIAKKTLENNFNITTLSSSQEAIAFSRCQSTDIVLINTTLIRSLDCIELLGQLRYDSKLQVRAFATTSFLTEDRMSLIKNSGFEDILTKPITLEKVKNRLAIPTPTSTTADISCG